MTCEVCGEDLVGDGYSTVMHCPNKDVDDLYLEPDSDIVYCESSEEEHLLPCRYYRQPDAKDGVYITTHLG